MRLNECTCKYRLGIEATEATAQVVVMEENRNVHGNDQFFC
jgi:hypothetical protein